MVDIGDKVLIFPKLKDDDTMGGSLGSGMIPEIGSQMAIHPLEEGYGTHGLSYIEIGDRVLVRDVVNSEIPVSLKPGSCETLSPYAIDFGDPCDGGYNYIKYTFKRRKPHHVGGTHTYPILQMVVNVIAGTVVIGNVYGSMWIGLSMESENYTWVEGASPWDVITTQDIACSPETSIYTYGGNMEDFRGALDMDYQYIRIVLRNSQTPFFSCCTKSTLTDFRICD